MNRRPFVQGLSVAPSLAIGLILSALVLWGGLLVAAPATSWAAGFSAQQSGSQSSSQVGNQSMGKAASLIAPEPDEKVAIYRQPDAGKSQAGYGLPGDAVTILERVSDNQSMTWNHIRFEAPPYAEGWVQETFIDLKTANSQNRGGQSLGRDRYLGNQPPPSNQQNSQRQSYSQRN